MQRWAVTAFLVLGAASAQAEERPDISGPYIGASLSWSEGWTATDYVNPWSETYYGYELGNHPQRTETVDWWSAGALAGYNWSTSDGGVIGLEARIGRGFSDTSTSTRQSGGYGLITGLFTRGWASNWTGGRVTEIDPNAIQYPVFYDMRSTITVQELATPDLSIRLGRQIGNVLLFTKVGAGAAFIKETRTLDDSGSTYCHGIMRTERYETGVVEQYLDGCSLLKSGFVGATSSTKIYPVLIGGFGAEIHFDRYFLRGEAEYRAVLNDDFDGSIGADIGAHIRATTAIGLRF